MEEFNSLLTATRHFIATAREFPDMFKHVKNKRKLLNIIKQIEPSDSVVYCLNDDNEGVLGLKKIAQYPNKDVVDVHYLVIHCGTLVNIYYEIISNGESSYYSESLGLDYNLVDLSKFKIISL